MPKTYIAKPGDTLRDLAQRFLGSPSKADILFSFNRLRLKSTEISPGETILIPETSSVKNIIKDKKIDNGQLILHVGGKQFYNFEQVRISRSLDSIAHIFYLKIVLDSDNFNIPIKPYRYESCKISIGDTIIISGKIEYIESDIDSTGSYIIIQGRSLAGILIDVSYPARPNQFLEQTLEQISNIMANPFGIGVSFSELDTIKFEKIIICQDEKIFSFLTRLANMRGFLITSDYSGNLFFTKADFESKAVATIVEGSGNFDSANAVFDGTKRYSDISMDGQKRGGGYVREVATDDVLVNKGINRPLVIQSTNTPENDLTNAVKWERGKRIGESTSIKVKVDSWLRLEDNILWDINESANVLIPSCFISNTTKMLIKDVEFYRDVDGTYTILTLILPDSYTLNDTISEPWEN